MNWKVKKHCQKNIVILLESLYVCECVNVWGVFVWAIVAYYYVYV